jgi:hypothetical protein
MIGGLGQGWQTPYSWKKGEGYKEDDYIFFMKIINTYLIFLNTYINKFASIHNLLIFIL